MEEQWALGEAKQQFSKVVQKALDDGPQIVTRGGKEAVVVLSAKEYRRLKEHRPSFKEMLAAAPLDGVDLERPRELVRDIDL